MAGMSGTERVMSAIMQSTLQKALEDPRVIGYVDWFKGMANDIIATQKRTESKLDRILSILEAQKDPAGTELILDHLALLPPEELIPLYQPGSMMDKNRLDEETSKGPGPKSLLANTRTDLPSDWLLKSLDDRQKWLDNNPALNRGITCQM